MAQRRRQATRAFPPIPQQYPYFLFSFYQRCPKETMTKIVYFLRHVNLHYDQFQAHILSQLPLSQGDLAKLTICAYSSHIVTLVSHFKTSDLGELVLTTVKDSEYTLGIGATGILPARTVAIGNPLEQPPEARNGYDLYGTGQ